MNEPFDVELSRALKEGAAKSLAGWEFTPAMRAKVLERVQSEQAEQTPAAPPTRRVDPIRWIRPVAWVAAAAAAFVIVANLGGIEQLRGGAGKTGMKTASAPAPQSARSDAAAPTAPPDASFTMSKQNQAPAGAAQSAANTDSRPADAGAVTMLATTGAPAMVSVELTVPAGPDGKVPEAAMAAPEASPRLMTKAMSAAQNVSLAVNSGGPVLALTPGGLKAQTPDGAAVWERPLADLNQQSLLAEAPDGRAAVANGANLLYLLNDKGEVDRKVYGSAPIEQLVWSNDGRVAAAEGTNVVVYEAATGNAVFTVAAGANRELSFAPDGLLAVTGDRPDDPHRLALIDKRGLATVEVRPVVAGRGLVFAAGGAVVVAGGQAYSRLGKPLWQMPVVTEGIAAGGAQVVGWDAHTVVAVDAYDGHPLWKADWNGEGTGVRKVVLSPDGRYVAIVAPVAEGAALWLMDSTGKVLHSERLPQMPVALSFAGDQVVLLMPQSVIYRSIPQP